MLGEAGLLRNCVPQAFGGVSEEIDSRSLCLIRETLGYADGLADFAFAMQGLGTGAISLSGLAGTAAANPAEDRQGRLDFGLCADRTGSRIRCRGDEHRRPPRWRRALSSTVKRSGFPTAASPTSTPFCPHRRSARYTRHLGFRGFRRHAGLIIVERLETIAPHPLARIRFDNCRIPAAQLLGSPGEGFKIAMRTLDIFRPSVAAAAIGFARRALDEAVAHAGIAKDVRCDAGRPADGAEHAGRNGDRDRCGGTS